MSHQTNWAGNLTYRAANLYSPETIPQIQELVRASNKLRALGTRHSFNAIADTDGDLISLQNLNRVLALDPAARTVTVEPGIKYGELATVLTAAGWALPNLASLPHISVAGAVATATHGSGVSNGNLATSVAAMELITADGQIVQLSPATHGDQFQGMVVNLGALGVITNLTLNLVPSFQVRQDVYINLPPPQSQTALDAILSAAYSVSLFTDWRHDGLNQVWLKSRVTDNALTAASPTFYGAVLAATPMHPIATMPAENCTAQLGVPGPWHERLPHFRMEFTPSAGDELQTEYFVPRAQAFAAFNVLTQIRDQLAPLVQISEIRTIAADALWLSPAYHQDSVALHFTWVNNWDAVRVLLPTIEAALEPFNARPHWGKLFIMSPARLQSLYPRLPAFKSLVNTFDPTAKFRNAFLNTYLFD